MRNVNLLFWQATREKRYDTNSYRNRHMTQVTQPNCLVCAHRYLHGCPYSCAAARSQRAADKPVPVSLCARSGANMQSTKASPQQCKRAEGFLILGTRQASPHCTCCRCTVLRNCDCYTPGTCQCLIRSLCVGIIFRYVCS